MTMIKWPKKQPQPWFWKTISVVEGLLQGNSRFKTTILRFGGLIGEDRIWSVFAGRENLEKDATI
jgi:hypothetical protein